MDFHNLYIYYTFTTLIVKKMMQKNLIRPNNVNFSV